MGNEASMEGDGALAGEVVGSEAELSCLSEEERRRLVGSVAETQARASEHQQTGARGPVGLSKSRTVDAFGEGPPPRPKPGRSPSSLSLLESRFRQEPKDPEQPRTGMFSSSFLSGVSSAVSSASIPKFSLFGDDEEEAPKQGSKPSGPQQVSAKGQGPPEQKQGPPTQATGGKPAGLRPGTQKQGPKPGDPGPQQEQSGKSDPRISGKHSGPQVGPPKAVPQPGNLQRSEGLVCPLCKSTELNLQAKDQLPNYNTCTQCKQYVCSLCGFSPPDSAGKEWLCLNCQMQRAMGGMEPPGSLMMKQPPKQSSAPPSPQRKEPPLDSTFKDEPGKKPPMLTKQQSISDKGKGATPPATPTQKMFSQEAQQSEEAQPGTARQKCDPQPPPLQKHTQSSKDSPQPSPAKNTSKQDGSSFFGGFGLGGLTDMTKPPASESVTGKLLSGFGSSSKPQGGPAAQTNESVTGKLFSSFSGLTETTKPSASAPQSAEGLSGKMFGFGSSILSSASNLIGGDERKSPPVSTHDSPIDSAESPPGSPPDSESPPDTPPVNAVNPASPKPRSTEGKTPEVKPSSEDAKAKECPTSAQGSETRSNCPLCKVDLNIGSRDVPNYSSCTECQKIVCNLCGFNPTPHLTEKEWLCLNCQTQRALSGKLGDMPPLPSPKSQPTPPSSPARAVSSTPVASAKGLTRTPSVTQASADKFELDSVTDSSEPLESAGLKEDEAQAGLESKQVVPNTSKGQTLDIACENTNVISTTPKPTVKASTPPTDSFQEVIAHVNKAYANQSGITEQTVPYDNLKNGERSNQNQCDPIMAHSALDDTNKSIHSEVSSALESVDENYSEATYIEIYKESELTHIKPFMEDVHASADNDIVNQACGNKGSEVSPYINVTGNFSTELASVFQTSAGSMNDKDILISDKVVLFGEEFTDIGTAHISNSTTSVFISEISESRKVGAVERRNLNREECELERKTEQQPHFVSINPVLSKRENNEKLPDPTAQSEYGVGSIQDDLSAPASPSPEELRECKLKTKYGLTGQNVCPKIGEAPTTTLSITDDTNNNPHKESIDVNQVVKGGEYMAQFQAVACSQSKVYDHESNSSKDCKTLKKDDEVFIFKTESTENLNQVNYTGYEGDSQLEKEPLNQTPKCFEEACLTDQTFFPKRDETLIKKMQLVHSKEIASRTETVEDKKLGKIKQATERIIKDQSSLRCIEVEHNEHLKNSDSLRVHQLMQQSEQMALPSSVSNNNYVRKISADKLLESDTDIVQTKNESLIIKDNLLSLVKFPETEIGLQENKKINQTQNKVLNTEESVTQDVPLDQSVQKYILPDANVFKLKKVIQLNQEQSIPPAKIINCPAQIGNKENGIVSDNQEIQPHSELANETHNTQCEVETVHSTPDPVVEPPPFYSLACNQAKDKSSVEVQSSDTQDKKRDGPKAMIKSKEADDLEQKKDATVSEKDQNILKIPNDGNEVTEECSPTSPSDLAKLESTVFPILGAQVSPFKDESQSESVKSRCQPEVLPVTQELVSEESKHDKVRGEKNDMSGPKKERKKLLVPAELQQHLLEDSSEGESSPLSQTEKMPGEEIRGESPVSTDKEFINKQKLEEMADDYVPPSNVENNTKQKLIDQEKQKQEETKDIKEKSESGKAYYPPKSSSISPDDEPHCKSIVSVAKIEEVSATEQPFSQNGAGIRHFKTIELTTVASARQTSDDGEPESLTDSPDDRSRGEGSSSLHASSFTPGTSPTSLSSFDEDSDSSSTGHIRNSGEGKQHRKAKHRQSGQILPTIEDSSEEEELREEEDLLKEQEKQKNSGKKSKKDKDEIRAQRRRERPKTPPSNLSPIEDASPTEELRQEAEMEEFRRSSCSDFSPSMESEPEGFEILPERIAAVQKVYQLPMSVSLFSPTDEQHDDSQSKETKEKQSLKTSDEAYEEIMLRAKSPTTEEIPSGKESFYGGMLIEDYAYESLVVDTYVEKEQDRISFPDKSRKLRSPDEVYEDMMKIKKEMLLKDQQLEDHTMKDVSPKSDIRLHSADTREDTISACVVGQLDKNGKPLLDAEEAYEELMKKQRVVLTPGTSPTQPISDFSDKVHVIGIISSETNEIFPQRRILSIPDLTVTQCSSGEEESGEESSVDQNQDAEIIFTSTSSYTELAKPSSLAEEQFKQPTNDLVSSREEAQSQVLPPQAAMIGPVDHDQPGVVDLSKTSAFTQVVAFSMPTTAIVSIPSVPVASPLPTVPQYTPTFPSVISTAPPVPPKPLALRRGASQEKTDIPVPPPLPPPTLPKPAVYPKKLPPQVPQRTNIVSLSTTSSSTQIKPTAPTCKSHVPPPVPPKPSSIPAGLTFSHRPGEPIKPPIAPKPMPSTQQLSYTYAPVRPSALPTSNEDGALNLSPAVDSKPGAASPIKSPTSPRFGKSLCDTYVVITLPSQPGSPIEGVATQAPTFPPGLTSSSKQTPLQPQAQPQLSPSPQQKTIMAPVAFTKITESIESQEIYASEKVLSNMSHVYETISASQPSSVIPNVGIQVVSTEVQRTSVSVLHESTPPPALFPRQTSIPAVPENLKSHSIQVQNGHAYQVGDVVDLRTQKNDVIIDTNGLDLSPSESQRQPFLTDGSGRQQSAVQSSVINLSTDTSSVSIVTDSITILTCSATIAYSNSDTSQTTSVPLQLKTAKSFEPISQIIYRPVDSQPEKPINLSTTVGKTHSVPVTAAHTVTNNNISMAGISPQLETLLSGAVDLTTIKPVQTMVSVDGSTTEVVTAVITEDDGKPVDLTAGKRAVCCEVVYKLPFAGSCATQQPSVPLPEDRFGYRDDHYQYDRSPYGMRGLSGIKPSMSDTNLAEAGLFLYKSKNSYDYLREMDGAVDLTSGKVSVAGEIVDYTSTAKGAFTAVTVPQYSQSRITSTVGTQFGGSSVLRSSNGVVYSSVAAPVPSTYAITTQPGSIFSTTYNSQSGMHTSDTMPSLSNWQHQPLTKSHSFLSTSAVTTAKEQDDMPLNLEISVSKDVFSSAFSEVAPSVTTAAPLDYTDASLEAIAASLEALSSPMIPGDEQYQMEREILELEKIKQQRLAEELEWERQEIQRFREQEQLLVQKELEELQAMKQHILCQQEEERQAHLMMQKETYAQQQEQLEQIQRLQEQLRLQLEEQKYRQMYPDEINEQPHNLGTDKKTDSGCQTDEEDNAEKAYSVGRKKKSAKKGVDSCVQTDDEDQDEWELPARGRRSKPRGGKYSTGESGGVSVQAHTEISVQTDLAGHSVQMDTRLGFPESDRISSPKRRPTPLEISQSPHLTTDTSTLQVSQAPLKSPKVLYSPISPCMSPSKSLEFVAYEKSVGDTSPQKIRAVDPSVVSAASPRAPKVMQRSLSDPKPMSPTAEERAANFQYPEGYSGKGSPSGTPTGTQKKVKRTLPNPPSEEEATKAGPAAYSTASARRRLCRNSNMARAKILQDIDRELDLVERESSKLRKKQAELDEEEKEIDAKLRYLEMGINRRKDALLKEREKRERAYLQGVAEDRDYMSDSEVSNIRETRRGEGREEISGHGLERPHTAPQSELDDLVPPQTKYEYGKYSQYHYPQYQQSLYQSQQPYSSQSIYSSVPSLTASQQQSYHQLLLLQQKARQQAALLSELDATKVSTNYENSSYMGGKYGSHLDLHVLEDRGGSMAGSPLSSVSADSFYADLDQHHQTPRSYMLLEDANEIAKNSSGLSSTSYGIAERELAKAERLLRRTAADVGSDYLSSSTRLHSYGKAQDEEDPMEDPYELKILKQQLKQEFRRSTGGTESLEQLAGLSHHYTSSTGVTSGGYRPFSKTEKYSISRLTLEKQAAKQLPTSMLYQKHKSTSNIGKYSSMQDSRGLDTEYSSYLGSSGASSRSSRLLQDEITFGLRKNIAEQQKYLGSTLGANLAGSLNLGQCLNLGSGVRSTLGDDSAYPSGSRSRPSSRPSSMYGLDLSIKRDISSSSLRLKSEGNVSSETTAYQAPSGRTKPNSLPIGQGGRGRIPIVAQNSEEESPLSPVGQPMGMARASAGPLPPISADSRDQFGSCLSLQDPQQQHLREDPTRGRSYMLIDDLQGTMSDSEALSESLVGVNRDDPGNTHENITDAYHLRREETDWFDKPREEGQGLDRRQAKSQQYPFPYARVKLQRDPKDHSVSGNGLGIRVAGGKEVPGSNGEIGAYVAKVLPGGAAEQTGQIVEGMQVLEWNGIPLSTKTYEEVQGLVSQQCGEAELCVRLDLNMLSDSEGSHLDLHEPTKAERPSRSPGVDPKQLAAELQKVSQQQVPSSSASSLTTLEKVSASGTPSAVPSPGQPGSPSISKKRHSKTSESAKTQSHPVTGEIQLQINYDKQLGNLIVHVLQARNLAPRDNNGYSEPFVKVYLLPGRGAENKRRSKHAQRSLNPEWNQTVIYKNIHLEQLRKKTLEVSVWDYDKCSSNDFLGEVLIDLSNTAQLDNVPRWLPLKEQCEGEHHRRSHSGQGRQHSPKVSSSHSPKTSGHSTQDSPKSSVIKSRSHGIFPDPAKDTQVPTIEKSHSSPSTSKPSPSEGQTRSHGTPRTHSKSGTARAQPDDAMGTAEAGSEQHRLQPTQLIPVQNDCLSLRHQRHSITGILTIQKALSYTTSSEITDGHHLTLRKAMSEERPQLDGASLDSGLSGSAFSLLEEESETNEVDSAIFQVPRLGKIPNGTDAVNSIHGDTEGKTQMMGEIKIALKKEMKTEGEHLVLEILQCRNITYKFKSPDHLPDMYVKLYVVNIATQKRIIKKKTRVCRHDREPSFNETFRFCMNPTGHSIQLFLVSNGGKFGKKTLIGEAYVWLDKVDLRKRVISWHKLLATTAQIQS